MSDDILWQVDVQVSVPKYRRLDDVITHSNSLLFAVNGRQRRLGSLLSVLIHRGIPITVKVKALYVVRGLKRETLLCTRILYETISASRELDNYICLQINSLLSLILMKRNQSIFKYMFSNRITCFSTTISKNLVTFFLIRNIGVTE